MTRAILLHPDDDVAVLVEAAEAGATIEVVGSEGAALLAAMALPLGHKIAVRDLDAGQPVRKYGEVIGMTTGAVRRGDHLHTHNLVSLRAGGGPPVGKPG